MGNPCCVKEKRDQLSEINTMEMLLKLFNDDKTVLQQRKAIFTKFKNKNSNYSASEMEFARNYKDLTTIELNKLLDVYDKNLYNVEMVLRELRKVESYFDEKAVAKIKPHLNIIRNNYDLLEDEPEGKIEEDFTQFKAFIKNLSMTMSKNRGKN